MAKTTIVHLSDLHIQPKHQEEANCKRIVNSVAKNYKGAVVLITGDVTDSASRPQMTAAKKLLGKLAQNNTVLVVPGNHDYNWNGILLRPSSIPNWNQILGMPLGKNTTPRQWMGPDEEPTGIDGLGIHTTDTCAFFGVDSGDPGGKESTARGFISKKLGNALGQSLKKYKHLTRVVFLHHHPFTTGPFMGLTGSEHLENALKNNCDVLLFGHKHKLGVWWNKQGVRFTAASHKTTKQVFKGEHLMINVIEISKAGTPDANIWHRMELV